MRGRGEGELRDGRVMSVVVEKNVGYRQDCRSSRSR